MKKIVIVGAHGTGKSMICDMILSKLDLTRDADCIYKNVVSDDFALIPEQFREVVKDIPDFHKQTEEITLATYAKQLYLENRHMAQGQKMLCDRSVLDTFIYAKYFNNQNYYDISGYNNYRFMPLYYEHMLNSAYCYLNSYSKIYLIEPSDREIEPDGFRLTDKKEQLEIHKLFLEYFKDFSNVKIINQEEVHKEEFIEKVVDEFIL